MHDTTDIQDQLLELLARIEIDEHVELAINAWGDEGIDLLRRIARGDIEADDYQRANAAYLLGVLQVPKAADDLARILEQKEAPRIRLSALDGIRHVGDATARKALRKIATCAKSDATERVYAVEWLGQIGEDEDAKALENIDTGPADVLLAQRVHDAVKSIQYRAGWSESLPQGGEGDGGEEDEPKETKR